MVSQNAFVLATERLHLRPFTHADLDHLAEFYAIPAMAAVDGLPGRTLEEVKTRLRAIGEHWDRYGYGRAVLVEQLTGRVIGWAGLERDASGGEVLVSVAIAPPWRRHGYATEAARAWVRWASAHAVAQRLVACVPGHDEAAWRTLRRLGFVTDGAATVGRELIHYRLDLPTDV